MGGWEMAAGASRAQESQVRRKLPGGLGKGRAFGWSCKSVQDVVGPNECLFVCPKPCFLFCSRERLSAGFCISSSHLHTFSSSHLLSHLLIFTSAHLHICSSHLLIFTSAHLHICSSSHLLIFTSAPLHICSSSHLLSHLLIFTPSHLHTFSHTFSSSHLLHIFSSSHLLLFTSAPLHTFSHTFSSSHFLILHLLSHLLIFTSSSHLLIFTSAPLHICSSSHLLIFTPSHLHTFSYTFSSSHLLSLTLSPLFSLLSLSPFSLPFLSLAFFIFLSLGRGWCRRGVTKRNPFARNEVRSPKTEVKLRFQLVRRNPFAETRFDRQKLR